MKKFILPVILAISFLFFFPQNINAQAEPDCRKIFDKESYQCLKDSSACQDACLKETKKPDGTEYFNSGEIYPKCIKESQCHEKSSACDERALTNLRACGKSDNQPKATEVKKDELSLLKFFGINPYQTWLRLQELVEVAEFYASGDLEESLEGGFLNLFGGKSIRQKDEEAVKAKEQAFEAAFGKDWREQLNQPKLDVKTEEEAWESPVSKEESVIDVSGTSDTKRYSWDENSGVVVKSNDWEKIKFREPVAVEGFTSHTVELGEGEMEVKVRNSKPTENQFGVDAGWLGVTVSRTHFRVLNDRANKSVAVGVYEGEVKITTKDGQGITVVPDGDPSTGSGQGKPGVVVVSRKLSVAKLAIVGVVLAAIVGGIVWFIKRKKKK